MATYLPPEIMEKILSRLSVKSLVRFKSACKTWNALISSHPFIRTHLLHSSQSHTLFIQESQKQKHKQNILRFQDGQYFHVHHNPNILRFQDGQYFNVHHNPNLVLWCSCNGILLLENPKYKDTSTLGDLILWNPSMRKITQLFLPPIVRKRNRGGRLGSDRRGRLVSDVSCYDPMNYGLCYDPATVDLKVVVFYKDIIFLGDICYAPYAVYSCKNKSWSKHNVEALNIIYELYSIHPSNMVCVDGALYWVTRIWGTSKCGDLLCFESKGNKLNTVQRPKDLKESKDEFCVISLRGRLCVWWCSNSLARIWMREEGEDWRDFMRIEDIPDPCAYYLKQPLSVNMDEGENIEIAVCSETYYHCMRSLGVGEARRRVVMVYHPREKALEEFDLPLNENADAIINRRLSSFDSLLFFDQHPVPAAYILMQTQPVEQFKWRWRKIN